MFSGIFGDIPYNDVQRIFALFALVGSILLPLVALFDVGRFFEFHKDHTRKEWVMVYGGGSAAVLASVAATAERMTFLRWVALAALLLALINFLKVVSFKEKILHFGRIVGTFLAALVCWLGLYFLFPDFWAITYGDVFALLENIIRVIQNSSL